MGSVKCAEKLNKTSGAVCSRAVILEITEKAKIIDKHIPSYVWNGLINRTRRESRGKRSELDFDTSFLWKIYQKQNGKCALTGWNINFGKKAETNTVSIDRIDSNIGYLKNNIQLVHKDVNRIKNHFSDEFFYKVCKAVSIHRKDLRKTETIWEENLWHDTEFPKVVDFDYKN